MRHLRRFFHTMKAMAILDLKNRYPVPWAMIGEVLGIVLGLVIYRFTARAFAPSFSGALKNYDTDFFTFVLVGEMTLLIPLQLFDGVTAALRQAISQGTMEVMMAMPLRSQTPALFLGLSEIPRNFIRVALTLITASLFFGFTLSPLSLFYLLIIEIIALPAFLGLALIASAVIVVLGRGHSLLSSAATIAAVLAGAYFPVSVMPKIMQRIGEAVSPFNALLRIARPLMQGHYSLILFAPDLIQIVIAGIILMPLGYFLLGAGFQFSRKRGNPLLVT